MYYEKHHVVPTALGGADSDDNKVLLTAREHFDVHWLLIKLTEGADKTKMRSALIKFMQKGSAGERIVTARQFETARKLARQAMLDLSAAGEHPWQDSEHCARTSVRMTETQLARSAAGTHAWQTEEYRAGRSAAMTEMNTTNNPGKKPENRAAAAARMQQPFVCEHCGDIVKGATNYKTHHHDNCKFRTHSIIVTRLSDSKRFVFGSKTAAYEFAEASKLDECLRGSRSSSKGYTFAYVLKKQVASQMQLSGIRIITEAAVAKHLVVCRHCGTAGVVSGAMSARHFDNCRSKLAATLLSPALTRHSLRPSRAYKSLSSVCL